MCFPSSGGRGLIINCERGCQNQGILMEVLLRCSFISLVFLMFSLDFHWFSLGLHVLWFRFSLAVLRCSLVLQKLLLVLLRFSLVVLLPVTPVS